MVQRISPQFADRAPLVFLAVWSSGGRVCTLVDLLFRHEWLNREIPTAEELDGALNRLLAAGLVAQRRGGFCVPARGVRKLDAFRRRRRRDRFDMARDFVQSAGPLGAVPRRVAVRTADHAQAYGEYLRLFKETWEKLSRGRARG